MRRNWKKTTCFFIACSVLIGFIGSRLASLGAEGDPAFVPALDSTGENTFEALQDTAPGGLMWGKELNAFGTWLIFYVDGNVTNWANAENAANGSASLAGGYPGYDEDHPNGWRPATVGEILQARKNGLLNWLDFSYNSYWDEELQKWDDFQSWDDPLPVGALAKDAHGEAVVDPHGQPILRYTDLYYHYTDQYLDPFIDPDDPIDTWGEKWYSSCTYMQGHRHYKHTVRYGDGTSKLHLWPFPVIPVRGAPPNHDGCPKVKGSDIPDIPGKNKSPKPPKK